MFSGSRKPMLGVPRPKKAILRPKRGSESQDYGFSFPPLPSPNGFFQVSSHPQGTKLLIASTSFSLPQLVMVLCSEAGMEKPAAGSA